MENHKYSQLIFDKGANATQWGKESFQQMVWNNWMSIYKEKEKIL